MKIVIRPSVNITWPAITSGIRFGTRGGIMHSRSEWLGAYGDLLKLKLLLRERGDFNGPLSILIPILIMIVEDKLKERES